MFNTKFFTFLLVAASFLGCTKPSSEAKPVLNDASDLQAEQLTLESVRLTWQDNAQGEVGYRVFLRGEGEGYYIEPLTTLSADSESYTFGGLTAGAVYDFGIQAVSEDMGSHSSIVWLNDFKVSDWTKMPQVTKVDATYAYVAVSYKIVNLPDATVEHGVCFSAEGAPTVDDIKVQGPEIRQGAEIMQVVPNAYLEAGKEYGMSVYVRDGEEYMYSEPQTVKLAEQPAAVELAWEKQEYAGAEGVDIYRTVSQLNGRNFNAWYAVADPSQVEFKVLDTPVGRANCKTVAEQAEAAEGCLALINGGIYGNYHIGVIFTDGESQEWVDNVYNNYWSPTGDGSLWNITRPIIGVDRNGKAGAYWTASPAYGTYYYYTAPLPTVVGEAKYPEASDGMPVQSASWMPYNALSTGPMLLYDGKCCINHEKNAAGNYMTNYECWALDIYEGRPDRTAVGVTADGKIVLFICDGRIEASQGATHEEVAMIMKAIGCVHAMNLDGGGSTGMWVKDAGMINHMDGSWRAVKSTLGFFSK